MASKGSSKEYIALYVNINQAPLLAEFGAMTFDEAAVLSWMLCFPDAEPIHYQGKWYKWFSVGYIAKQLPMLGTIATSGKDKGKMVTSKRKIHRILKRLINVGAIERHPDNPIEGKKSFYHITERAISTLKATPTDSSYYAQGSDYPLNSPAAMTKLSQPPMTKLSQPPMTKLSHNSTLTNSTLKDRAINAKARFASLLASLIEKAGLESVFEYWKAPSESWFHKQIKELGREATVSTESIDKKKQVGEAYFLDILKAIKRYSEENPKYIGSKSNFALVFNTFRKRHSSFLNDDSRKAIDLWEAKGKDAVSAKYKTPSSEKAKVQTIAFVHLAEAFEAVFNKQPTKEQCLKAFERLLNRLPAAICTPQQFNAHFIEAKAHSIIQQTKPFSEGDTYAQRVKSLLCAYNAHLEPNWPTHEQAARQLGRLALENIKHMNKGLSAKAIKAASLRLINVAIQDLMQRKTFDITMVKPSYLTKVLGDSAAKLFTNSKK